MKTNIVAEALVDVLHSQRQVGSGALLVVATQGSSALSDALQSPIAWWILRLVFCVLGVLASHLHLSILGIAACAIFAEIAITLGALVLCVIVALVSP